MKPSAFARPAMILFALMLVVPTFVLNTGSASAATPTVGAVYTLTNATTGNAVVVFKRAADGSLTLKNTVATGGLGTGAGLGSEGALVLGEDKQWLFAVNAGSNTVSVFAIGVDGLHLTQTIASGGVTPISIAVHGELMYVLNAGGTGNITGFTQNEEGFLAPLPASTRPLSTAAAGPAQIAFNPAGTVLVVTEKTTNSIDTYTIDNNSIANGPIVTPSSGMTPFGFAWTKRGQLLVSEASGGNTNASAASSYQVHDNGSIHAISASVPTHQTAACWLVATDNSRYAYTANAGSGTISGYSVGSNGSLSLLNSDGITGVTGANSHPIDMALSRFSHYLYVLNSGNSTISVFAVQTNGSLLPLNGVSGLALSVSGLAAR
ncbi:MAG: beta-propeller fold lactonase family protein [Herpetosiphonaceae bacterium]|nr:beta-propeller fold lactonase family protein [Herpetosiphonaceae bacterium]